MNDTTRRSEVAQHLDLSEIRYSMVWEDHALLESGLQIQPDDHLLAIMSGGNNVLSMLLREPAKITAIDMSPAQVALFQLKLAGIRHLDYVQFCALMGFAPVEERLAAFHAAIPQTPSQVVDFWDKNVSIVENGIFRCGRLDRYFEGFQTGHLAELWAPDLVGRLFDAPTLEAQRELFYAEAFSPAFQRRFVEYFGQESMAKRGRDPAQFKYVDHDDVGEFFLERFEFVCTQMPLHGNFYVERFLTGTHRDLALGPEYLRPREFQKLKGLVDRIEVVHDELEVLLDRVPANTFSKCMLSDVFEYMSQEDSDALFTRLARGLRPGGRIAYWNLLVPRGRPESLADCVQPLRQLSRELWQHDRAWFYRDFCVDEVTA